MFPCEQAEVLVIEREGANPFGALLNRGVAKGEGAFTSIQDRGHLEQLERRDDARLSVLSFVVSDPRYMPVLWSARQQSLKRSRLLRSPIPRGWRLACHHRHH